MSIAKWKQKTEEHSKKSTGRDKRKKEKPRNKSLIVCLLCYFMCYFKMDKIYYQPNHLWKGQKAIKKLKELSKEKLKAVKQWLSKQAFWQVYVPPPKHIDRPHYLIRKQEAVRHQIHLEIEKIVFG